MISANCLKGGEIEPGGVNKDCTQQEL